MSESKICPKCGTPQQWELWRHCACGHDFGPSRWSTQLRPHEPEPKADDGSRDADLVNRFLWRLLFIAAVTFFLTMPFHKLEWINSAAGFVLVVLLWAPISFPSRKQ